MAIIANTIFLPPFSLPALSITYLTPITEMSLVGSLNITPHNTSPITSSGEILKSIFMK